MDLQAAFGICVAVVLFWVGQWWWRRAGICTLCVLLPKQAEPEYQRMARAA